MLVGVVDGCQMGEYDHGEEGEDVDNNALVDGWVGSTYPTLLPFLLWCSSLFGTGDGHGYLLTKQNSRSFRYEMISLSH